MPAPANRCWAGHEAAVSSMVVENLLALRTVVSESPRRHLDQALPVFSGKGLAGWSVGSREAETSRGGLDSGKPAHPPRKRHRLER